MDMRTGAGTWQHGWCMRKSETFDITSTSSGKGAADQAAFPADDTSHDAGDIDFDGADFETSDYDTAGFDTAGGSTAGEEEGAYPDEGDVIAERAARMRRNGWIAEPTTGEMRLEERSSLRRVAGLSTELTDV